MQPGWYQPVRQEFMENECEALPGVAYPGVRDNRSTINTKTGYDDDDDDDVCFLILVFFSFSVLFHARSKSLRKCYGFLIISYVLYMFL